VQDQDPSQCSIKVDQSKYCPLSTILLRKSPPPVQIGLRRALKDLPAAQLRQFRRSLEAVVRGTAARGVDAPFFDVDSPSRRR
jgi:hypothetical protein